MYSNYSISLKEAKTLGIVNAEGLGFVKPQTAFRNITEKLIAEIQKGNLVWRQGWKSGVVVKGRTFGPQNYESQRPYTGANAFWIFLNNVLNGTNYNFFLTPKQIAARGGKIKKDAKPFPVFVFIKNETPVVVKRDGKDTTVMQEEKGIIWYHVYPIDLVDNLKPIERKTKKEDTFDQIIVTDAETIINNMPKKPSILNGGNKAYYRPATDTVQMPLHKAFKVPQEYYSVLFHELIHSTGNKKRLGRDMSGRFGDKNYATEELIAEIGAAFLCGVCEIDYYTINNSAAYLKGWSKTVATEIKVDPNFLKRAVFKAAKAANFIIGKTLEKRGIIKGDNEPKEKPYTGKEITPNKNIKASVAKAIEDLTAINPLFKHVGAMGLTMLYSAHKNQNFPDTNEGLKGKIFEKMEDQGLVDYEDQYQLTDKGKEAVEKIENRLATLKAKKTGTDLFPELAGIDDKVLVFLNSFLQMHNRTVSKEELAFILMNLQNAIKLGVIKAKHPLRLLANTTQEKLVNLINRLQPKEKVTIQISNKTKIENEILGLHGLGFWNIIAGAVIGKGAELLAAKHLFKKPEAAISVPALNGIEGFVRADKTEAVKMPGTFRLKGELGKFLGDIQPFKYSIVLTGDPHAGKTEVVMQLANAFSEVGKTVGTFMLEQGGMESKDTKGAIDRNISKDNLQRVFITGEAANGIDTVKSNASKFDVIIVDSWQKLGIPSTKFDELRHECPNTIFIVIFQQNGEGGTRGGVSANYDTPVLLKVHRVDETFVNNYVEVKKNRGNSDTLAMHYMVKAKKTISNQ